MTEFKIIEETFGNNEKPTKIVNGVQESMRNGWQPSGDICISNFSYDDGSGTTWIAQSMLKTPGNIIEYILVRVCAGKSIEVENYLLKGYELFGSIKSVGRGLYYQVVIKRMHLIPEIL